LYPQRITGDIECTVLVAEFRIRGRLERRRIDIPYCGNIPVKQEDVTVERPGAALRAGGAPEPNVPDYTHETFYGILKKGVLFMREGGDAVRDGNEGNDDHRCVQMGRVARDMAFVSFPFSAGIPCGFRCGTGSRLAHKAGYITRK
jgi:hypothetical protein